MLTDIVYYLGISVFFIFFMNPTNLKSHHIHLTSSLFLSYLILFPSHLPQFKEYLYQLRFWFLIYLVLDFEVSPPLSLLHYIAFLVVVSQHDKNQMEMFYGNESGESGDESGESGETFRNMNIGNGKENLVDFNESRNGDEGRNEGRNEDRNGSDFKDETVIKNAIGIDLNQELQQLEEKIYKGDNHKEEAKGHQYISDRQLNQISSNQIGRDQPEIRTFTPSYTAQGTDFTHGYNYGDYGDLLGSNLL